MSERWSLVGSRARHGDGMHHAVMVLEGPWSGTYTASTLCGRQGIGLPAFEYDVVTLRPTWRTDPPGFDVTHSRACMRCAEVYSARYAAPLGVDRTCRLCREVQDVGQFKTDLRTSDGLSLDCFGCRIRGRPRNAPCSRCGQRLDAQHHGIGLCAEVAACPACIASTDAALGRWMRATGDWEAAFVNLPCPQPQRIAGAETPDP